MSNILWSQDSLILWGSCRPGNNPVRVIHKQINFLPKMMCRVLAVFSIIAQQLKEDIIGNLYAFYSYNLYRTTFFRLFLYLPNIFDAVQGRILGGGGPPNFIKREKTMHACTGIEHILVVNGYPDPPISEILYPPLQ